MTPKFKIGDKLVGQFPESALRLGGECLMVITVNGREPEYCIRFSTGATHTFPESLVSGSLSA